MFSEKKYSLLKSIFWDYNTELLPLHKIIERDLKSIDEYELQLILKRMLERLSWYDLLDVLGIDLLKEIITPALIGKLRNKDFRDRYERIRRILFKESLPFSGWDPQYRKRIESTVLSHRWNRT